MQQPATLFYKTLFLVLFLPFTLSSQEKLDLFIWAGQSKAQGWMGDAAYFQEEGKELDESIRLNRTFVDHESSGGKWIRMQPQAGRFTKGLFGPEVSFGRELKKADNNPVILKYTKGATGLARDRKDPGNDTLKVITYNIWNGFDWGKDTVRRKKLQQWMKKHKPSVAALQELCAYTPQKLQEDAESWGHNYSVILKTTGYSVGLTSEFPIHLKEKIQNRLHHGALHCQTAGIDFLVVHLHPGSIKSRMEEAEILLRKLEKIKNENSRYIVLGDFNAHSPFDAHLYDSDGYLLKRLRENNSDKGINGNVFMNDLDFSVMASFLAFPLYDVARNYTTGINERGSFPGRVLGTFNNETTEQLVARLERIDYILVSPSMIEKCIDAKVNNGVENWFLSDHYPVQAKFIFN